MTLDPNIRRHLLRKMQHAHRMIEGLQTLLDKVGAGMSKEACREYREAVARFRWTARLIDVRLQGTSAPRSPPARRD